MIKITIEYESYNYIESGTYNTPNLEVTEELWAEYQAALSVIRGLEERIQREAKPL